MAKKVKKSKAEEAQVDVVVEPGPILDHVQGHESQIKALKEAIERERLPQTLLFVGSSGVGKRKVALGFAQVLVCERRKTKAQACGECGSCIRVARLSSEDLMLVEPQGASIKIEQAQDILRFISLRRLGRARIIIIDEAHQLGPQAGNALLKSLEEPPAETFFILLTHNPGAILTTIRSRSQVIRFQALSDEILKKLTGAEDWQIRAAQGSLETLKRLSANSAEWDQLRRVAFNTLNEWLSGSIADSDEFREAIKDRSSALFLTQTWLRSIRDFHVIALDADAGKKRLLHPDQATLTKLGAKIEPEFLAQLGELALELEQDINRNIDRGLAFENFAQAVRHASGGREPKPVLM
jgi:DNA polymerase-3 subunit delta'